MTHKAILWGQRCQNWIGSHENAYRCERSAMGMVEWFATCRECHDSETTQLLGAGLDHLVMEYKELGWRTDLYRRTTYAWIDRPLGGSVGDR